MSALKALNFVPMPKSTASDPKLSRRNKLVAQLEQQRALAADEHYTVPRKKWVKQEDGSKSLVDLPKRVKRWWRLDGVGNCYFIIRYGNKVLAPTPDKEAVAVGDKSKLVSVLNALIEAAKAGELDAAIDAATAPTKTAKRKAA